MPNHIFNQAAFHGFVLILAVGFSSKAIARTELINQINYDHREEVIARLSHAAVEFCSNPQMYGVTKEITGQVHGTISASKVVKLVATALGSIESEGRIETYVGVERKSLKDALADSNTCRIRAFDSFRKFYLELGVKNDAFPRSFRSAAKARRRPIGKAEGGLVPTTRFSSKPGDLPVALSADMPPLDASSGCADPQVSMKHSQNALLENNNFSGPSRCAVNADSSSNLNILHNNFSDISRQGSTPVTQGH